MALHKSTNGGESWTTHEITSAFGCGYTVAINPYDDNIIYVGGHYEEGEVLQSGLFKTLDGGNNWVRIGDDISGLIYVIAADLASPNMLFVGTTDGIFKSEDSGFSWTQVANFDVKSLKIDPASTNEIFAAGENGVYFSSDGGYNWEALNNDFIIDHITSFDMDLMNNILFAVTSFGSIYRNRLTELYMLAINAGSGGTTNPNPQGYIHDLGTDVTIEAISMEDWGFGHWSGDVPQGHENDDPLTITLDSDKYITANFIQIRCKLTIDSAGGGTTDPSIGTHKYDTGTEVTIRATADSGYRFGFWTGDASGIGNPITITMDSDKSITAIFSKEIVSGKKGGCFIATAAYGSPLHPYVNILRDFRDKYLMPSKLGRVLVNIYYKYSPFLADLIKKHKVLKVVVRFSLLPVIVFSYLMVHLGPIITAIMLVLVFALPAFVISFFRRRLQRVEAKDFNALASRLSKKTA